MKNLELYIDIREEMELIKENQQKIALADEKLPYKNTLELWKIEIVWEYLRNKLILNNEMPRKNEYLN